MISSRIPIYVKSPDIRTVRELSLTYDGYAHQQPRPANTDQLISESVSSLLADGALEPEDVVVVVGGTPELSGTTNFLVINSVAHCLQEEPPAKLPDCALGILLRQWFFRRRDLRWSGWFK